MIGLVLLGCLVVWIGYSLATYPLSPQVPEPGGPKVRGGNPAMPDKAMEAALADATAVMKSNYQSSHSYRWWSRWRGLGRVPPDRGDYRDRWVDGTGAPGYPTHPTRPAPAGDCPIGSRRPRAEVGPLYRGDGGPGVGDDRGQQPGRNGVPGASGPG